MKLKRLFLSLMLVSTLGALTSCQSSGPKISGDAGYFHREDYVTTYRGLRLSGVGYAAEPFSKVKTKDGKYYQVNNVGTIVVPVDFTDYPASGTPKGEQGFVSDLQKAILGKAEETAWHSLKSYYNATSYGICNISGTVAPVYHTNKTVVEFAEGSTGATQALVVKVRDWLKDTVKLNLTDYDANEDGFIDSIIMIYTCPPHVKDDKGKEIDDDLYWAFCYQPTSAAGNIDDPSAYRFFWASYNTFFEDGYYDEKGKHQDWTTEQIASGEALLDAHTLIHEFGHVMSLPDYYNGDYNSSDPAAYDPLCRLDMMAYNVGDHNAFSKALYNWIEPIVVNGDSKITIRSTTDTGDFIILPVAGQEFDTLLDQYLTIEFLTPTGVAYSDSLDKYAGSYPQWYNEPGIRVCLVDARPGKFNASDSFIGFTYSVNSGDDSYVRFACDNNAISRSCYKNYKLIELIPATGKKASVSTDTRIEKENERLFHAGDEFGTANGVWNKFMVDGTSGKRDVPLNWSFKVTQMNDKTATIEFTKLI